MASIKVGKYEGDRLITSLLHEIHKEKLVMKKHLNKKDVKRISKSYNMHLMMFKGSLFTMVRYLNEMELLDIDGFHFEIRSKYFTDESTEEPIESYVFKVRFLTVLYVYILNNLDEIIEFEFGLRGKKAVQDRYEILFQIIEAVENFTVNFLKGKDIFDSIQNIYEFTSIGGTKKQSRVFKTLKKQLEVIRNSQIRIPGFKFLEMPLAEDKIIHNLSKIAYVLATNDVDVSKTGNFIKGMSFDDKESLYIIISSLGKAVRKAHKEYEEPMIWTLFFDARPKMVTSYNEIQTDKNVEYGCKALFLLSFVCGSKEVQQLIYKMIL